MNSDRPEYLKSPLQKFWERLRKAAPFVGAGFLLFFAFIVLLVFSLMAQRQRASEHSTAIANGTTCVVTEFETRPTWMPDIIGDIPTAPRYRVSVRCESDGAALAQNIWTREDVGSELPSAVVYNGDVFIRGVLRYESPFWSLARQVLLLMSGPFVLAGFIRFWIKPKRTGGRDGFARSRDDE